MTTGPPTGGSAGANLAAHFVRAYVSSRQALAQHERDNRAQGTTEQMESWEAELAPLIAQVVESLRVDGSLPDGLGALLNEAAQPSHQTSFILQVGIALSALVTILPQLGQPLVNDYVNRAWSTYRTRALPADVAAGLLARSRVTQPWAYNEASLTGVNGERMDALVDGAANMLTPDRVRECVNRGLIDEATALRWIEYAGVHPDQLHVWHALGKHRADPASAILAVVQSHLSPDDAKAVLSEHGIVSTDYDWLVATAGEPPGVFELGELVNRGELSEDDWAQAIRESRIKNKYIPALQRLRFKIPPERSVVAMMRNGAISADQGTAWLHQLGFRPDAVAALVSEATNDKLVKHRDLSESMIVQAYEARLTNASETVDHLVSLGYDSTEAHFIVSLADHRRTLRLRDQAVGAVRSHYVAHKVDRQQVSRELDRLGVPAGERDDLVTTWDVEMATNVHLLSEAQLGQALKKGLIDMPQYHDRLVALGYTSDDADLLAAMRLG